MMNGTVKIARAAKPFSKRVMRRCKGWLKAHRFQQMFRHQSKLTGAFGRGGEAVVTLG